MSRLSVTARDVFSCRKYIALTVTAIATSALAAIPKRDRVRNSIC
jgi:hypothetical protein